MSQSSKSAAPAIRRVVVDPHGFRDTAEGPSCDFILASLSHDSTDLRLHRYSEKYNQTRLTAILTDVGAGSESNSGSVKSLAWSPSAGYASYLACGTGNGQIVLHDLSTLIDPSSRTAGHNRNLSTTQAPSTKIMSLPAGYSRACTNLKWSKLEPGLIYAGYEKARSEKSLLIWDIEHESGVPGRRPVQSLYSGENITSIEPLDKPHTVLVGFGAGRKHFRLVDHREPAGGSAAISWTTKAIHGLTVNGDYAAAFEEGTKGIVKVFDLRYPTASGAATPLASQQGAGAESDIASYIAGSEIVRLAWTSSQDSSATGRGALGVGTKDGSVLIMDLNNVQCSDGTSHAGSSRDEGEDAQMWTGFTRSRRAAARTHHLADFAYLPAKRPSRTSVVSLYRDATYGIEHFDPAPGFACNGLDELATSLPVAEAAAPNPENHTGADTSVMASTIPSGINSEFEVGTQMRQKAEAGYGLDLPANDAIEANHTLKAGFLFLWLDRFISLMGRHSITKTEQYDFTLQGLCSIWYGLADGQAGTKQTRRGFDTLSASANRSASQSSQSSRSTKKASRSAGPPSSRMQREGSGSGYVTAILSVMEGREQEFVATGIQVFTERANHRRLMLGICGELAGERLETEIYRIAQTQPTKAACLALFTDQRDRAVEILRASSDEKHRLMASLVRVGSIEAEDVDFVDPYLRALGHYLQGSRAWESVLQDQSLPLLERLVLALRFVDDERLPVFLDRQLKRCIKEGDLQGLPLTGLTQSRDTLALLQNYLDRTSDVQTVAIISCYLYGKSRGRSERWVELYRAMLNRWRLHMDRVDFDIARGIIARQQGIDIENPVRTIVRCNYCQKSLSGDKTKSARPPVRTDRCSNCQNTWPKCCICLMPTNAPAQGVSEQAAIESALVFCQTCHHGGHQGHILDWFYGPLADETSSPWDMSARIATAAHDVCAVADCNCSCATRL